MKRESRSALDCTEEIVIREAEVPGCTSPFYERQEKTWLEWDSKDSYIFTLPSGICRPFHQSMCENCKLWIPPAHFLCNSKSIISQNVFWVTNLSLFSQELVWASDIGSGARLLNICTQLVLNGKPYLLYIETVWAENINGIGNK